MPELTCPLDGETLTMPSREQRETDGCTYVVQTSPGTVNTHIRDAHPERWASMCAARRRMNASDRYGMPRRVDGCFLRPGEDVGDLPV